MTVESGTGDVQFVVVQKGRDHHVAVALPHLDVVLGDSVHRCGPPSCSTVRVGTACTSACDHCCPPTIDSPWSA
jgi:hypothetical protein